MEQVRNIIKDKLDSGLDQQLVLGILTKHMVREELSPTLAPVLCMEMMNPIWRDRHQIIQSYERDFHFGFYGRDKIIS